VEYYHTEEDTAGSWTPDALQTNEPKKKKKRK